MVSHNHYDHLDLETLGKLWHRDQPLIVTPLGNDALICKHQPSVEVQALDWGQSLKGREGIAVHVEPSQHWSARNLWDHDKALWGAFVVETPSGNLYFAGDTGYAEGVHFRKAKEKFGGFRFALLPIGAYEPRWFMQYAHMSPDDAALAFCDLDRPYTAAIHHRTFNVADEGYDDPVNALAAAKKARHIPDERFRTLKIGEAWELPSVS